jgi:hypothetical protein
VKSGKERAKRQQSSSQPEYTAYICHLKMKNMRSVYMKIGFLFLTVALLFSCSKISSNNNIISCSISYTLSKPLKTDQQVQYIAGISGTGGTISSLTYLDSAGNTTVQNPTLPFIKYVNLKKNIYATISAQGTANLGGQLLIYIRADSVQNGTSCNN